MTSREEKRVTKNGTLLLYMWLPRWFKYLFILSSLAWDLLPNVTQLNTTRKLSLSYLKELLKQRRISIYSFFMFHLVLEIFQSRSQSLRRHANEGFGIIHRRKAEKPGAD